MALIFRFKFVHLQSLVLCQNSLKGKPKDETMINGTGNLFSENLLHGAKLCAEYKHKHTFSATLAFKSASMNKLTLDPPNRILMQKIQMIDIQKDYFSIIED